MASALSVSGFDMTEFTFYGFLPREKKELREKLLSMAKGVAVAAVHESPYRVTELVEVIADLLPDTRISCSCDLTKLHEKTIRGTAEEVLERIGHPVGGVCPFGCNEGIEVYLDESLKRFETVFPACGSSNSAIELTISELEQHSNSIKWIDVCKILPC